MTKMTTSPPAPDLYLGGPPAPSPDQATNAATTDDSIIDVAVAVVLVQGAIGVTTAIEAAVVSAASGGLTAPVALLTATAAVVMLLLARGIRRRSRRARKLALILEPLILLPALVDTALAVFLTGSSLELVPTLTRFALPIAVFVLLRRPQSRRVFGIRPRRRDRKRMAAREVVA